MVMIESSISKSLLKFVVGYWTIAHMINSNIECKNF